MKNPLKPCLLSLLALYLPLSLFSCGGNSASQDSHTAQSDSVDSTSMEEVDEPGLAAPGYCNLTDARLLRTNPWLGQGVQLYAELPADFVVPADPHVLLKEASFPATVEPAPQEAGLTGILLLPSPDAQVHQRRTEVVASLLTELPLSERIAIWTADPNLRLVSDLTADREYLLSALKQVAPAQSGTVPGQQLDALREGLAEAEGRWGSVWKSLIVVGQDLTGESLDPVPSVALYRLVEEASASDGGGARRATEPIDHTRAVRWSVAQPGLVAQAVALDQQTRRLRVVRIGACAGAEDQTPLSVWMGQIRCEFNAPKPAPHLLAEACDPAAAAADDYPFGDTFDLVLTDDEKAIFDQRHAAQSKEDFRVSVRLGQGSALPATAHFRGQTSMNCQRKNYDINLDGGSNRRLAKHGGGDKFFLVSLCKDDGYYNTVFANNITKEWGLFPLESRLIRLRLNGQNQGIYLLIEDPADTLVKDHLLLEGVVRRPFDPDPDLLVEVKYSRPNDPEATLGLYNEMVALAQSGPVEGMPEVLKKSLDLRGYLRWMALMTFMHNGDYVDEIYFYGSVEAAGLPTWRVLNWDADDLFSSCHHNAMFALPDPAGMLFCAEGFLDQALVRSPEIYAMWVDELLWVMDWLSAGRIDELLAQTKAELFALLDDETAATLVEFHAKVPEATTEAGAEEAIQAMMQKTMSDIEASRSALQNKVAAWKQGRSR